MIINCNAKYLTQSQLSALVNMKLLLLLLLVPVISHCERSPSITKHPFIHVGNYEVANETVIKYFYSGNVHASSEMAMELCKIFDMQLLTFKDTKEEKSFRENFAKFFDGRDSFILIGANTTSAGSKTNWKWMNGEKLNFELKWSADQPNNEGNQEFCLCLDENDPLVYHDISCTEKYPFVCKEIWTYERILVKV